MIKPLLLVLFFTLFRLDQDVKVITFSTGKTDSDSYESLSFWIKSNQRAYVRYTHGKDADDVELTWVGPNMIHGRKGFGLQFPQPDTTRLIIIPQGDSLEVTDRWGKYRKEFNWENENGAAGDSTCSICAQDAKQAMAWLHQYFFH